MQITKNKVAIISYTLTINSGEIADEATKDQPFGYIHGTGHLLPAFEAQLEGLQIGNKFDFTLTPEEGYGTYEEENVAHFPIQMFTDAEFPADMLYVGGYVPMQDQQGNPMDGEIVDLNEQEVVVDFNHPLAGEALRFVGEVIEIREASAEEMEHGHVHGLGGQDH